MKIRFDLGFLIILFFGVTIGIQLKAGYSEKYELSFLDREIVSQINQVRRENADLNRQLKLAESRIEVFEKSSKESEETKRIREEVENLKLVTGYSQVSGEGITIKIDTKEDLNLGLLMEEKKWFLSLINDIKHYGGESISINGQRIGPYSEVVLAGNHININSIPIGQPYEISAVGDTEKLLKYLNETGILLDTMRDMYNIDIEVKSYEKITIPKLDVEKKLNYARR